MSIFSIFSHTPNKYSENSSVLHYHEVTGDLVLVKEAVEELTQQGYQVNKVLRFHSNETNDDQARPRRSRH